MVILMNQPLYHLQMNNVKTAFIDPDKFDELALTSFVNNNVREGKIDGDQWDEQP